jgi:hypothetical protein
MQLRLVGTDCWIALKRLQDRSGEYRTYLFCQTKQRGMVCPRDKKGGKKAYELCPSCFESVGNSEFLTDVIYPGLLEVRTAPMDPTVGDLISQQNTELDAQKDREKKAKAATTHVK